MADIPKLRLVENVRKDLRFTFDKTATPIPVVPVDEVSVKIIEAHQKRASAEVQTRAEAEAHVHAMAELVEAQKRAETEDQKSPEPLPLSTEEEAQKWRDLFITENKMKFEEQERKKLQQDTKEAIATAEEKKIIDELLEKERITHRTPVKYVEQVPQVTTVAPVVPVRIRRYVP